MAGKNYDEAVDAIKDALDGIPGPQQGETAEEYKVRFGSDAAAIVDAVEEKGAEIDGFVEIRKDAGISESEAKYDAVRRRFTNLEEKPKDELET